MGVRAVISDFRTQCVLSLVPNVPEYIKSRADLHKNIAKAFENYQPTKVETAGDWMLIHITSLPKAFVLLKDPSAQIAALGTGLVALVIILAYPSAVYHGLEAGFTFAVSAILDHSDYFKIAVVFFTIYTIVAWSVRAVGRFKNPAMVTALAVTKDTQEAASA